MQRAPGDSPCAGESELRPQPRAARVALRLAVERDVVFAGAEERSAGTEFAFDAAGELRLRAANGALEGREVDRRLLGAEEIGRGTGAGEDTEVAGRRLSEDACARDQRIGVPERRLHAAKRGAVQHHVLVEQLPERRDGEALSEAQVE